MCGWAEARQTISAWSPDIDWQISNSIPSCSELRRQSIGEKSTKPTSRLLCGGRGELLVSHSTFQPVQAWDGIKAIDASTSDMMWIVESTDLDATTTHMDIIKCQLKKCWFISLIRTCRRHAVLFGQQWGAGGGDKWSWNLIWINDWALILYNFELKMYKSQVELWRDHRVIAHYYPSDPSASRHRSPRWHRWISLLALLSEKRKITIIFFNSVPKILLD